MAKSDQEEAEIITAKWKTKLDAEEKHFGTIELSEEFRLEFPMLDSIEDIPMGTTVLWGRTGNLQRCTAVTLPFGPHGGTQDHGEQNLHSNGAVSRLMIGRSYIADPAAAFVSEIHFVPRPNGDLHMRQVQELIMPRRDIAEIKFTPSCAEERKALATAFVAFFEPERGPVVDAEFQAGEIAVRAWIGGSISQKLEMRSVRSHISFTIRFKTSRDLESALDEANKLFLFFFAADPSIHLSGRLRPFRRRQGTSVSPRLPCFSDACTAQKYLGAQHAHRAR